MLLPPLFQASKRDADMTDYDRIYNELRLLFDLTDEDIEKYGGLIKNICSGILSALKKEPDEEEQSRIDYLCAVKSFYNISLIQNDGIKAFSAGDVSYTVENGSKHIKQLLDDAYDRCSDLISGSFVFKAV